MSIVEHEMVDSDVQCVSCCISMLRVGRNIQPALTDTVVERLIAPELLRSAMLKLIIYAWQQGNLFESVTGLKQG